MHRSVFTVAEGASTSSNQYSPIMPLRPNAHQAVTFSTQSERYWCSWGGVWGQKHEFCAFTWPLRSKFALSLKILKSKKSGRSSVCRLTSALLNRGRSLRHSMLPCTLPVSLNLSRRRFIVSLVGGIWLESHSKIVVECRQLILSRNGLYSLDALLHGISWCLIHWSWEINLWSSDYDLPR